MKIKTWEMIKALTENPELKFKSHDGYVVAVTEGNGCIRHMRGNGTDSCGGISNIRLTDCGGVKADEWELIPQEVTWQEAIQAWADGKKSYYVLNGVQKSYLDDVDYLRVFDGARPISKDEISKGKWFVE